MRTGTGISGEVDNTHVYRFFFSCAFESWNYDLFATSSSEFLMVRGGATTGILRTFI